VRVRAALLPALALCWMVAGCGSGGGSGDVTIVVSSRGYTEEEVLREIYAHALEAAGFTVRRRDAPDLLPPEELESGRISGYPDHLDNAIAEVTSTKLGDVPGGSEAAYREARRKLAAKGLVPFQPVPFGRLSAIAVPRRAVEERHLETLADLKKPSREMSATEAEGNYCYCHGRECLANLEGAYGIVFGAYSTVESPAPLYKALRSGETDAAIVLTTEGRLARENSGLVVLEDDVHRLPAANAFWMTSRKAIEEAGPDYERTILTAQKGLTLKVMRRLDAAVELEGKAPAAVAAEYLKSIGDGR
jgi:osmoprotectant transport system substrate-binding protein